MGTFSDNDCGGNFDLIYIIRTSEKCLESFDESKNEVPWIFITLFICLNAYINVYFINYY